MTNLPMPSNLKELDKYSCGQAGQVSLKLSEVHLKTGQINVTRGTVRWLVKTGHAAKLGVQKEEHFCWLLDVSVTKERAQEKIQKLERGDLNYDHYAISTYRRILKAEIAKKVNAPQIYVKFLKGSVRDDYM